MTTAITMTPAAIAHFQQLLNQQGKGKGLRLAVKTTGCSGKKYTLDVVDAFDPLDYIFAITEDLLVSVDPESFCFVKGTEIDYGREGLNKTVKFNNPNVAASCGCGESFTVKNGDIG